MKTAVLGLILLSLVGGESYKRLSQVEGTRFYRTRGRAFLGRHLHLLLPPAPFLAPPKLVCPPRRRAPYHLYTYRGIKFLVHPQNPYYQQFRRKKKKGKIVCVKGRVADFAGEIGTVVLIHRIRGITRKPSSLGKNWLPETTPRPCPGSGGWMQAAGRP